MGPGAARENQRSPLSALQNGEAMRNITTYPNLIELSRQAARIFADTAARAVKERGRFCVCLSGGGTPRTLYSMLAAAPFRSEISWSSAYIFWGDERCVPPDHPDSNYRMARDSLLSKVPIPAGSIRPIRGAAENPAEAASEYETMLKSFFDLNSGGLPRFDLILLGMGPDGHTASLFPETEAIEETRRLIVANRVPKLETTRLTLTLPVLNNAALVLFLVAGADKAPALKGVFMETERDDRPPASLVDPQDGDVMWLVDQEAAALL